MGSTCKACSTTIEYNHHGTRMRTSQLPLLINTEKSQQQIQDNDGGHDKEFKYITPGKDKSENVTSSNVSSMEKKTNIKVQKHQKHNKVSFDIKNKQLTEDVEVQTFERMEHKDYEEDTASLSSSSFGTNADHNYTIFDNEEQHYEEIKDLQFTDSDRIRYSYSSTKFVNNCSASTRGITPINSVVNSNVSQY